MGSNGNKKPSRMSSQHPPVNLPPQNFLGTPSHVLLLSHCMPRAWSLFLTTLPSPAPPHPTGIQQQLREPRIREGGADGSRERERQNCHHCSIQGKPRGTSLLVSTAGIPRQPPANRGPTDVFFIKCFILLQMWSIISNKSLQGRRWWLWYL